MESLVAVMLTYVLNVSVSHVSQRGFRTGAGQTSDQRRGGAPAATGSGHEQRGCRAGTYTNTHVLTWQSISYCVFVLEMCRYFSLHLGIIMKDTGRSMKFFHYLHQVIVLQIHMVKNFF